jgi:hypothetical protein
VGKPKTKASLSLPPRDPGQNPEERVNHYISTSREPIEALFPSDSLRTTQIPAKSEKPAGASKPTKAGNATAKPAANAQINATQARELAILEQRGAPQVPGKLGGGKKKGEKVSPTPRPQ